MTLTIMRFYPCPEDIEVSFEDREVVQANAIANLRGGTLHLIRREYLGPNTTFNSRVLFATGAKGVAIVRDFSCLQKRPELVETLLRENAEVVSLEKPDLRFGQWAAREAAKAKTTALKRERSIAHWATERAAGRPTGNRGTTRDTSAATAARCLKQAAYRATVAFTIQHLINEGRSQHYIARYLNDLGIPTSSGKKWFAASVRSYVPPERRRPPYRSSSKPLPSVATVCDAALSHTAGAAPRRDVVECGGQLSLFCLDD